MKHQARKRFGQHFLTDQSVLSNFIGDMRPTPSDTVVEIGPGLGALTAWLLKVLNHLHVVEIDRDLAERLRNGQWQKKITVHEVDVLKFDFQQIPAPFRVVGNLPYNISSPILFALLELADHVTDQHFMLQKEVIDRMVAQPATADYGRLSVMLQWRYDLESVLDVPPEAFEPPPRVESAVVRMQPWPQPAALDAALLEELVAVAFSQRRKLLRHTLGRWLEARGAAADFDVQRRAEEVPVAQYVALAAALSAAP